MNFKEYQQTSQKTADYPDIGNNIVYPVLGLLGEAGEVAEKVKKVIRDHNGVISEMTKQKIKLELGDTLWYLTATCNELGITLDDVAHANISKTHSLYERGMIHGEGDER